MGNPCMRALHACMQARARIGQAHAHTSIASHSEQALVGGLLNEEADDASVPLIDANPDVLGAPVFVHGEA